MADQNQNNSPSLPESSSSEIYKCAELARDIFKKMRSLYEDKELLDIALIAETDNTKVQAHKNVLSTCSEFFRGMFRSGMKEAKSDEIKLKEIDGKTLTSIVGFMYTASIELNSENIENIFRAARRFQMNNLLSPCSDFMVKRLDCANCLGIAFFAEQHNATALCKEATTFALKHFETVCKEKEFFDLNKEQLNALISSDELSVSSEENVLLSLVAWVEYDKENREALIFDILSAVRFTFLKPKFIIKNRHSLCKTIESCELIFSWLEWHLSPESRSEFSIVSIQPRNTNERLAFASGKFTNDIKLQIFDRHLNTWSHEELPRSSKNRQDYRSIGIGKKLIVVGGKINNRETNAVEYYDSKTKKWTDLPSMGCARALPGIAELSGDLYVVGGHTDGSATRSVEKYDFTTGKWQEVAPLLTSLKYPQVVALEGLLYAVGQEESSMECYDPDINQWIQKAFRNEISKRFGFAAVSGHVYAVGGYYNDTVSRTVECYHPSTDTWTEISSLRKGQSYMLCAGLNNQLIACRGHDGTNHLDLVEEYNPETNEWTTLASIVPHDLRWLSSTLLKL